MAIIRKYLQSFFNLFWFNSGLLNELNKIGSILR